MADKRQSTQVAHKSRLDHHGNSVAAWIAVLIMIVGFFVAVLAWVNHQDLVLYGIGGALIVVGAIVGKVLQMMGLGLKDD